MQISLHCWCVVEVSRDGSPDCPGLVELFVHLYEVQNSPLEEFKYINLYLMEEVRLREVTHNTGNVSKHLRSLVNVLR
jgi:hypothetical protein